MAALESLRQAEFLAGEVLGVPVASTVFERLRGAADAGAEGRKLSLEVVDWLRSRVEGVQITSFHGSAVSALALVRELGARADR